MVTQQEQDKYGVFARLCADNGVTPKKRHRVLVCADNHAVDHLALLHAVLRTGMDVPRMDTDTFHDKVYAIGRELARATRDDG